MPAEENLRDQGGGGSENESDRDLRHVRAALPSPDPVLRAVDAGDVQENQNDEDDAESDRDDGWNERAVVVRSFTRHSAAILSEERVWLSHHSRGSVTLQLTLFSIGRPKAYVTDKARLIARWRPQPCVALPLLRGRWTCTQNA